MSLGNVSTETYSFYCNLLSYFYTSKTVHIVKNIKISNKTPIRYEKCENLFFTSHNELEFFQFFIAIVLNEVSC